MPALTARFTPSRALRLIMAALMFIMAAAIISAPAAQAAAPAATITVDGTTCTLVDAITAANTDTATGGCIAGSGADAIDLQTDVTLTSVNNGNNGLPVVSSVITIAGHGHTIARDGAPTTPQFRILKIAEDPGNLTINEITIAGGDATNGGFGDTGGGGILNQGMLTVNNSTIVGNAAASGGGIDSQPTFGGSATLTINNSTIALNAATVTDGGGIANGGSSNMVINNSTISGNDAAQWGGGIDNVGAAAITGSTISSNTSAEFGGGVYNTSGPGLTMTIRNSTISGNTSSASGGGGVYNDTRLELDSVTITDNTAPVGGALLNSNDGSFGATATVKNTILANSVGGVADCAIDKSSTITNSDHNLVEAAGTCPFTNGVNNNIVGSDPSLGPLQNNGGPTQTHGPLVGSPAIDAGDTALTTDQRGISRPAGTADDIGAVERQNPTAVQVATFTARPVGPGEWLAQLWRMLTGR